jgi:bis(5'-nucleosyl)-tetraphosphatase (symmetrical)
MGKRFISVLGNHDVHLLRRHFDLVADRDGDTLEETLAASDRDELIEWLRKRPLLHRQSDYLLVHAGLRPEWSEEDAARRARRLEQALRGREAEDLLRPKAGSYEAGAMQRRQDLAVMTRVRMFDPAGQLADWSGSLAAAPASLRAWFSIPHRRHPRTTVLCGHWAALGLHLEESVVALDSGCAWGGPLTAIRLEDRVIVQQGNLDRGP